MDAIYTDFQKSSDKVNYTLVFHIFKTYGRNFLNWLLSYLMNCFSTS